MADSTDTVTPPRRMVRYSDFRPRWGWDVSKKTVTRMIRAGKWPPAVIINGENHWYEDVADAAVRKLQDSRGSSAQPVRTPPSPATRQPRRPVGGPFIVALLEAQRRKDCMLVHGHCTGRDGRQIASPWIEHGDIVYDPVSGDELSRDDFYKFHRASRLHTYSPDEARKMAVRKGSFGPWGEPYTEAHEERA